MRQLLIKGLSLCCAVILLVSAFGGQVFAAELSGKYASTEIPELRNVTWMPLKGVSGTEQTAKYFIIHTAAGSHKEDLYLSFPAEGGFRLQSKHEAQKKLEVSNVGLFEPSSIGVIDYKIDASKAVLLTGADGTMLRYQKTASGFKLTVLNAKKKELLSITEAQIYFAYNRTNEAVGSRVELPLTEREAIYGGGEKFNDTNHVGHSFSLTNADAWSLDDYSYINVPLFHSNRCYSIWFNMTYPGIADVGDSNPDKYTIQFSGEKLDFYLWAGTPLENIKKYTAITGTSGMPEEWAFGFWTGAMKRAFEETKLKNAYANLQELFEGYKEHYNFYPEACHAEGTNSYTALPLGYANQRGVRMFYWFYPASPMSEMGTYLPGASSQYPVPDGKGGFKETGYPYLFSTEFLKQYGEYQFIEVNKYDQKNWYDFSNPATKEVIKNRLTQYWEWGLSGAMIDYGENLPFSGTAFNGLSAMEMHNLNSYYYAKHASEAWTEEFGNDYMLYERSGVAGSQYYVGNFLGDQTSDWKGFQKQIYAMVAMGASGFNLYGGDLGALGGIPSNDLWNRWVVLSTFSPFMRQQGSVIHMPWDHGMIATATFGDYYYLRKNLVPTLMDAAMDANKNANPILKGMMIAYPYQLKLADINNQYLFCDDFLVCAVTKEHAHSLDVHLPAGEKWYSLFTYDAYNGGKTVTVDAPTTFMPVFVKDGAVKAINLPESMNLMTEMHDEEGTEFSAISSLLVTPPVEKNTSTIYVKDGESEDYRTYASHTETYVNEPKGKAAFTVTNTQGSDREIVLAVGVTAAAVAYDGTALTRLDHIPTYWTQEYGYYVDLAGKTHIFVPAGWKQLEITMGEGGYTSYELQPVTNETMKNMFDADVTTSYLVPTAKNVSATFKLAADTAQTVGRMEIRWTAGFVQTYDVEYSLDGTEWNLLLTDDSGYTVGAGAGGIDVLEFDPVEAKYFRFTTVQRGDAVPAPAIYSLSVCAPDPFTALEIMDPEEDEDWLEDEEWDDEDDEEETKKKKKRKKIIVAHTPGSNLLLFIIIGAGVVVLAGAVFLFLLLKKKKKAQQAAEETVLEEEPPVDFPNQN